MDRLEKQGFHQQRPHETWQHYSTEYTSEALPWC